MRSQAAGLESGFLVAARRCLMAASRARPAGSFEFNGDKSIKGRVSVSASASIKGASKGRARVLANGAHYKFYKCFYYYYNWHHHSQVN